MASTRNGSLELAEDSRGLLVRGTITGTSTGDDVLQLVREGLADRMSFAFTVDWSASNAMTVRFVSHQFAGLHVRHPLAVTHIAGTLSAPSF